MRIFIANKQHIDTLIAFRFAYLESEHTVTPSDRAAFSAQFESFFGEHLGRDCECFLGDVDGEAVSVIFLIKCEKPANFAFRNGHTAMLMNVYTKPEHRGKGYASKLLEYVIDYARTENIACIDLSATVMGRPLYEKHGFLPRGNGNSEMRLSF
jgi:GNAT superfamily N-acetyltransferase